MGRIVVFSLTTCPHCKKAKAYISGKGFKFDEISLSDYPEKRTDMLKLADRLTVPQIFFGDCHVGGASELLALGEEGKLDGMYEALDQEASTDPMLLPPDYPPKEEYKMDLLDEPTVCIGDKCCSYREVMQLLTKHLDIKDRKHHLKSYAHCFSGTQLVSMLMDKYELKTRQEAVQVGQSLQESGFFDHVTHAHKLEDAGLFYRLHVHEKPFVLNTNRDWKGTGTGKADKEGKKEGKEAWMASRDPMAVVIACKKALFKVIGKHTDAADGLVAYDLVRVDEEFSAFEDMVCELQTILLPSLEPQLRLAICINIYNMLAVHAFSRVGTPKTDLQRKSFFDTLSYDIGGHAFSLNDIENGVLRANSLAPYHLRKSFSANDPRLLASLPVKEPRIHFALNCGALSCPPIKTFSSQAVDEELRVVAMAFLEQDDNCRVDLAKKTLYVTMILNWYRVDFGKTNKQLGEFLMPFLRGEKAEGLKTLLAGSFKVKFNHYDWTTNSKPSSISPPSGCTIV